MRTIAIHAGSVDCRLEPETGRLCMVFTAFDVDIRLFRVMEVEEAMEFLDHLTRLLNNPPRRRRRTKDEE